MTVHELLITFTAMLTKVGIGTARLDCLILLEDATGNDRTWLLAHPEYICQGRALTKLNQQIGRRVGHEPLAYIRGKSEFYGRSFMVTCDTLVPRPETEAIIALLRDVVGSWKLEVGSTTIVDVGTGSGCLAVTAKLEFPKAEVIGTDISMACLKIAKQNAKNLGGEVAFYQGDLLRPLTSTGYRLPAATLLANLPYVPDDYAINQAAAHEPEQAIFGGRDGLDLYRRLFTEINDLREKPTHVITESLPFQHSELVKIATGAGYRQQVRDEFIQVFQLS